MGINRVDEMRDSLQANTVGECKSARSVGIVPKALRLARKPDGRETLQVAQRYNDGVHDGIMWVDVPVVNVGWDDNELEESEHG
jgi:hypothetical protein